MRNKRILVLSTYPIKNPQHGGQKRTRAIYDAYKHNFVTVRHSAVFYKVFYSDYDADDIALSPASEQLVMQSPLTGDIVCGKAIFNDQVVKAKMKLLIKAFRPEAIHIEQPFQYLGIKPLLAELKLTPKIIFGSQNIEAPMKREILEGIGVADADIKPIEAIIGELEKRLSKECDLLVACTPNDLQAHRKMGAKHTVLASNGIAKLVPASESRKAWRSKFSSLGVKRYALFVGSAHPPNWTGFTDMVGKGMGFVPHDARIVAGGSISDYFDREVYPSRQTIEDATFWLRVFSAGRLSEERLSGLIQESDVILLPITEGGGSNLKTAEAIIANKKVVATEHALRSFEWFRDFPNVWVAKNQKEFQTSIVEALGSPYIERTKSQNKLAQTVEWKYCLAQMIEEVNKL